MSFQAMTWATEQKLPAMQKLVLLMLANRTNHDTGECYPSMSRMASDCGMSKDSVRRAINKLSEAGILSVKHNSKHGVSLPNSYRLNMPGILADTDGWSLPASRVVADSDQGSSRQQGGVVAECYHYNQEFEPGIEPEESVLHSVQNRNMAPDLFADQQQDLSDQSAKAFSQPTTFKPLKQLPQDKGRYVYPKAFEEFWSVYPVRDGTACKAPSYESWRRIVNSGCPLEDIVEGAKRYAAHCKTKGLTGTSMVKQAVTWLNGRCFTEWFDTDMHDALKQMREFMGLTDA